MNKIYISVDTHQEFQSQHHPIIGDAIWTDYLKFLKSVQDRGFQLAFKDSNGNSTDFNISDDLTVNH